MENEIENFDSLNEEEAEGGENQEEENLDALQKAKQELSDKNRKLFERAKKSETEVKELRDKIKQFEENSSKKEPVSQSNEPDYAKLAFLEQRGVKHPDDIKIVQDEATRLKLPLTDVIQMEHIKSRLETNNDERNAKLGLPKGGKSNGNTQMDVDYYLAKNETPDDLELAEKVINARIKKEKSGNKFSDELY